MRRASILAGVPFRTSLLFLAFFPVVLAITGYAILKATQASMAEQIRTSITEDIDLMRDAYTTGGDRELRHFIHDSVVTRPDNQFAVGLFDAAGASLTGNVAALPAFRGWGYFASASDATDNAPFIGFVAQMGSNMVVIGRAESLMAAISADIVNALIFAGIIICAAALAIGYILSSGVSRKLDVIDQTLDAVSRGNGEIRLPVGRSNDQIDHVSRQINAHLDRLSDFMASMRNTIVAIAHDLKSPLNHAYLLLQDAAEESDPVRTSAMLDNAVSEMETLGSILDTVLRISRIEASDDSTNFAPFSAAHLLGDLAQTFEPVLESGGQSLDTAGLRDEDATIFGDRKMVEQMLVNLIENAHRYAGPGARIAVGIHNSAEGASVVVADTGPGIAAHLHDEVFRPFVRIAPERNRPGSGLGLALVKAVATRHHARVRLDDNHPGLKVTVSFPLPPRQVQPRAA
jgi:signal transduction histidine kinase